LESNGFHYAVLIPLVVKHFNKPTQMGYAESPNK
jgi:hypothetical protein